MPQENKDDLDFIDRLASILGRIGFNTVRVRWKLLRLRDDLRLRLRRARGQVHHVGYRHRVCPECGQINDRSEKTCVACGRPLLARGLELARRLGLSMPQVLSASGFLGLLVVIVYGRQIAAEWPGGGLFSFQVATLYRLGGHWAPAIEAGQTWRWLTALFLHAGLWHLGFNLFALSQIGPLVEDLFGRGLTLLLYLLLGLAANVGTFALGLHGVGIGASGAIMGLCGLAAGWGQRSGTTVGREARNQMLKWAAYTLVFGYFIGADNQAHAVGFVGGAVLGYLLGQRSPGRGRGWVDLVAGIVGALMALGGTLLCLFPPSG